MICAFYKIICFCSETLCFCSEMMCYCSEMIWFWSEMICFCLEIVCFCSEMICLIAFGPIVFGSVDFGPTDFCRNGFDLAGFDPTTCVPIAFGPTATSCNLGDPLIWVAPFNHSGRRAILLNLLLNHLSPRGLVAQAPRESSAEIQNAGSILICCRVRFLQNKKPSQLQSISPSTSQCVFCVVFFTLCFCAAFLRGVFARCFCVVFLRGVFLRFTRGGFTQ